MPIPTSPAIAWNDASGPRFLYRVVGLGVVSTCDRPIGTCSPGTTTLLADAVRGTAFPEDGRSVFAWAAGEFEAVQAIRSHLRRDRGLKSDRQLVVSYWELGKAEDEAEQTKDH